MGAIEELDLPHSKKIAIRFLSFYVVCVAIGAFRLFLHCLSFLPSFYIFIYPLQIVNSTVVNVIFGQVYGLHEKV